MADHLRALLITLHIVAVLLMAAPVPEGAMERSAWQTPMAQDEIAAWADRLSGLGLSVTAEALEEGLWEGAQAVLKRRRKLLRPFRPYYKHCGTVQSWRLFVIPQRYPSRLHIDIRQPGGDWEPLYIARSSDADWQRDLLDTERMRSHLFRLSWSHYRRRFVRFGNWMGEKAAAEFPDAEAIRLRWHRKKTPSLRQVERGREPEGRFQGEVEIDLMELR